MSEFNKSYRIKTVTEGNNNSYVSVNADLVQDYDTFEVLSVNITSKDIYRLHNSNYGVIVGRVLANNGFGIPNAKVSIFIEADTQDGEDISSIYPFSTTMSKDSNNVRYNLLPNEQVDGCHQVVGTFPSKRYALDNDIILEVFDKYYTYTTKTNNAGDYMICGVPVGTHTLHMDLDLSDCGILSQRPRDFVYKGYTIEQFESPTKFKSGTDYNNLSQIFSQDQVVNVNPFWGNTETGDIIGITRADINVNFKFEPTCVFMGSIFSDNSSNGYSRKCIPTEHMGDMDELVTGEGTIEMIRKTPGGDTEEFQIKGNKLIDANGVWCYQIPMNLDYMITDEYGNMVPTDDVEKGIPTRACVRFRISMEDKEENTDNFFRAKVLVPHNPQDTKNGHEDYDYEFGTYTKEESFRDLFWNNVYTVKSYIPRIQRGHNFKQKKFSGIKHVNNFGPNNPMPYNNIRIKMPLMFTIMCVLIKTFIFLTKVANTVITIMGYLLARLSVFKRLYINFHKSAWIGNWDVYWVPIMSTLNQASSLKLITLMEGLCPDLENWYFAPLYYDAVKKYIEFTPDNWSIRILLQSNSDKGDITPSLEYFCGCSIGNEDEEGSNDNNTNWESSNSGDETVTDGTGRRECKDICDSSEAYNILKQTIDFLTSGEAREDDANSIDDQNSDEDAETTCLSTATDYLLPCIEMNLAQEYKVINFDFYNDWVNGTIYNPRWVRYIKPKRKYLKNGKWIKAKVKGCMDDTSIFSTTRKYVQQCAIAYKKDYGTNLISEVDNPLEGSSNLKIDIIKNNNMHKTKGLAYANIFGKNGGICHEATTLKGQNVYYLKPCEWIDNGNNHGVGKVNLYATDIVLLGTFNDCDINGIPNTFQHLTSTTYLMPTNLASTNMDTNGYLYTKDNGKICVGKDNGNVDKDTQGDYILKDESRIERLDGTKNKNLPDSADPNEKQTLINEYKAYSGTGYDISENYGQPGYKTPSDTIALTEASGISWDYTGPGQLEINEKQMYYPGGHFLGLTCVNSQTNLKSCLNLSRICEIGVNMSQRREDVISIDDEYDRIHYRYSVPTGFIAAGEIVDGDFRTMFATLNKKRLKATKRDINTNYKIYDFEFLYPINFDGAFSNVVNTGVENNYNLSNNNGSFGEDESSELAGYGVASASTRADYDDGEVDNLQTKTIEDTSVDYYLYRFGLTHDDVENNMARKRFLLNKNSVYYLPQYSNSYYFYFGLKSGATALDEFNKQFYSVCDNLRIKKEPHLTLTATIDYENGNATVQAYVEGMTSPYFSVIITDSNGSYNMLFGKGPIKVDAFSLKYKNGNSYSDYFPFGMYTVTVIDSEGVEVSNTIDIASQTVVYDYEICNFTEPSDGEIPNRTDINGIYDGGFVYLSNIKTNGIDLSQMALGYPYFRLHDEDNPSIAYENTFNISNDELILYANKPGRYTLQYVYQYMGHGTVTLDLTKNMLINDNKTLDLRLVDGNLNLSSNDYYKILIPDVLTEMSTSWWNWLCSRTPGDNDETDEEKRRRKWVFKRTLFKTNAYNDPMNVDIAAIDGKKVVWGTPQNNGPINEWNPNNLIYCTERLTPIDPMAPNYMITPGYTLDTVYKPTWGVNNVNDIYQYCAQVFDNNDAGGYYGATFRRDTDSLNIIHSEYFREGYGCIFKPLPFGELKFMVYNSNLKDNIKNYTNADYGIVYPTFIYPAINRQFYFTGLLAKCSDFKWNYSTESFGVSQRKNRVQLTINNGIVNFNDTNSNYYLNVYGINSNKNEAIIQQDNDLNNIPSNGLTGSNRLIKKQIVKSDYYSDDDNNIIEVEDGYPIEFEGYANKYDFNFNVNFYNNLRYTVNDDVNPPTKIIKANGEGYTDSNIDYYIGMYDKTNDGIEFLEEDTEKYYYKKNTNTNYTVFGMLNGGSTVQFEMKFVSGGWAYDWQNEFHLVNGTATMSNIIDVLDILYSDQWNNYPYVPILKYKIKDNIKIGNIVYNGENYNSERTLKQFFDGLLIMNKLMIIGDISTDNPFTGYDSNKIVFGVGFKSIGDEKFGATNYEYMIYTAPLIKPIHSVTPNT